MKFSPEAGKAWRLESAMGKTPSLAYHCKLRLEKCAKFWRAFLFTPLRIKGLQIGFALTIVCLFISRKQLSPRNSQKLNTRHDVQSCFVVGRVVLFLGRATWCRRTCLRGGRHEISFREATSSESFHGDIEQSSACCFR